MHINTFWKIVIKSIGLWLLVNCVWIIPQFTSTLSFIDSEIGWNNLILVWFMCFITLLVYVWLRDYFYLKQEWIIKILKTGSKIHRRERIELPAQTVLAITVL
jgi:hypothetical protein